MRPSLNVLFLGPASGNAGHRVRALERLGHRVSVIDPETMITGGKFVRKLQYETGGLLAAKAVERSVLAAIPNEPFDFVWVDGGRYVGPSLVRTLKERYDRVASFNTDDPLGSRDRLSWNLYKRAVPAYDLVVYNRRENEAEAKALGAKKVLIEFRTADEVAHAPRELTPEENAKWTHDVVFVGTGMEDRPEFMLELIRRGVPLTIYGNSWERGLAIPEIKAAWKGPGTKGADEYSASILGAKVCLGILSKGNRDFHTRRSLEIPALGGVLCAERTEEHLELYIENEEAVFWNGAEECAEACKRLLADESFRLKIARQGHERCLQNGHYNEPFCKKVIDSAFA